MQLIHTDPRDCNLLEQMWRHHSIGQNFSHVWPKLWSIKCLFKMCCRFPNDIINECGTVSNTPMSWAEMNPGCCLNISVVLANTCKNSSISWGSTLNLFITMIGPTSSSSCFSRVILSSVSTIITMARFTGFSISVFVDCLVHQSLAIKLWNNFASPKWQFWQYLLTLLTVALGKIFEHFIVSQNKFFLLL